MLLLQKRVASIVSMVLELVLVARHGLRAAIAAKEVDQGAWESLRDVNRIVWMIWEVTSNTHAFIF